MKLTFCGAAKIVTGSCYLIELENTKTKNSKDKKSKKYLVDCGMFQGSKEISKKNYQSFPFNPKEISAVFLTHAHIDHSGLLPKLKKHGFKGKIYATPATTDLCEVMLADSAHVQEMNIKDKNKERKEKGLKPIKPLYNSQDAKKTQRLFQKTSYNKKTKINNKISVRFRDAGHIVGSSIIELSINESSSNSKTNKEKKLVFSGDLGQWKSPIVKSPEIIKKADYVFIESTYGDRLHESGEKSVKKLKKAIKRTYKKRGKLMIPSFAVERTQQLLYGFKILQKKGKFPNEKVFLDSPLAIKVTKIFDKHQEIFNKKIGKIENPFRFNKLKTTSSVKDSKKINNYQDPCIIIAGSGMVTGGRILHHLKHNIEDSKNSILFVGYQAEGTTGREILQGKKQIEIMNENLKVKSKIYSIESLSAHADYKELIKWIKGFKKKPERVFITHGEKKSSESLKSKLKRKGYNCHIPSLRETVKL